MYDVYVYSAGEEALGRLRRKVRGLGLSVFFLSAAVGLLYGIACDLDRRVKAFEKAVK